MIKVLFQTKKKKMDYLIRFENYLIIWGKK